MKYDLVKDAIKLSDETYPMIPVYWAEDVYKAANRYEAIRRMSPQEFTELWKRSLAGEKSFDSLVDELIV